ncbi:MAG: hypothetical protein LAO78_18410 [Acidobacteriia bacterium]|nr:hypothetical protein [Terriglobia bacterium]
MPAIIQSDSDTVRNHVCERLIKPAMQRGERTVAVNVGVVHKALGLHNRVPLVCAALKSKKFLEEQGLRILSTTGPPSGQSTTVTFTYEILTPNVRSTANPLNSLRGVAKELFKQLGGGEQFIRSERDKFAGERQK